VLEAGVGDGGVEAIRMREKQSSGSTVRVVAHENGAQYHLSLSIGLTSRARSFDWWQTLEVLVS
jgi:hypothetical protein